MNENEHIIMEATLEELKAAERDLEFDSIGKRSEEILLAAIRTYIEAREMYGEED